MREMGVITSLFLFLWVGVTVSTAVNLQKRVIGGKPCDRPFHVKITTIGGDLECGGSLISKQWILTAAHCWKLGMKAVLSEPKPVTILTPPKIYEDNNNKIHDIMLLQLPHPAQISPDKIVKLPDCNTDKLPPKVQIAGRGSKMPSPGGKRVMEESDTLQCADIDVVACQGLKDTLKNKNPNAYEVYQYQHWICAKTARVDASHGDSGGGVVHDNKIYGVIAFIGNETHAFVEPVGFINVCKYITWIKTTAGIA